MNDWRDAHFAWVVEEQVMKKGPASPAVDWRRAHRAGNKTLSG